jgi:hypothetical protein
MAIRGRLLGDGRHGPSRARRTAGDANSSAPQKPARGRLLHACRLAGGSAKPMRGIRVENSPAASPPQPSAKGMCGSWPHPAIRTIAA